MCLSCAFLFLIFQKDSNDMQGAIDIDTMTCCLQVTMPLFPLLSSYPEVVIQCNGRCLG